MREEKLRYCDRYDQYGSVETRFEAIAEKESADIERIWRISI